MSAETQRRQVWPGRLIGILISAICIGLLARQVDLVQAFHNLARLNGYVLLFPLAVFLVAIPLRALRWNTIFPVGSRPGVASCLTALGIGNMTNFLLPWRAGDVARCVLVGRGSTLVDVSRTLATLGVEKALDGLALVGVTLVTIAGLNPPPWMVKLVWAGSVLFGGALLVMILLRSRAATLIRVGIVALRRARLAALGDRLQAPLASFADGLAATSSATQMLRLLALTAVIWSTEALIVWGLALSFGIEISIRSAALVSAVLALGLMVPAGPGGLGTYELAGVAGLKVVGVDPSSALALTLVIHAWAFITNVGLGLCLLALGVRPVRGVARLEVARADWSPRTSAHARREA